MSGRGRNVYTTARNSDSVAAFTRASDSGALTQFAAPDGCIVDEGSPLADCTNGLALDAASAVAVSGRNVYVAAGQSNAVDAFARDGSSGALSQLPSPDGCIVDESTPIMGCDTGLALVDAQNVTVSADRKNVYISSYNANAVAVFARR